MTNFRKILTFIIIITIKVTMDEDIGASTDAFPNENTALTMYGAPMSAAERIATAMKYTFVPTRKTVNGDIDQNQVLNAADALRILNMASGKTWYAVYGYTADVAGDGKVNAKDALYVLQAAGNDVY